MGRRVVELEVDWIERADLEAVDALARLQLTATRRGVLIHLRHPSADLLDLLRLAGLPEAFGSDLGDGGDDLPGKRTGGSEGPSGADPADRR